MDWALGVLVPAQRELPLSQESKGRRQRPSGRKWAVSCCQCGPCPLDLSGPVSPLKRGVRLENLPALQSLSTAEEGQAGFKVLLPGSGAQGALRVPGGPQPQVLGPGRPWCQHL